MLSETPRSREEELFRTQEHMQDFLDGESIDEVDCYPHVENMPSDYLYEVIDLDIDKR